MDPANATPQQIYNDPRGYGYSTFGPDANCTIEICDPAFSAYTYRPSLAANTSFIVLYFVSMVMHIWQGFHYKTWFFAAAMSLGCIAEILGYVGRDLMWANPFAFNPFLMQISCLVIAPVFFAAAIYVTNSQLTKYLDIRLARFPPQLYYYVFVACDLVSLILQAVGGALAAQSVGRSNLADDVALAGLVFQVFTLCVFIGLSLDFVFRYAKSRKTMSAAEKKPITMRLKLFAFFFVFALLCILARCAYRIAELREGYQGTLIHHEDLFIALEGVMILAAVWALNIAHPGFAFGGARGISASTYNHGTKDMEYISDSSTPSKA